MDDCLDDIVGLGCDSRDKRAESLQEAQLGETLTLIFTTWTTIQLKLRISFYLNASERYKNILFIYIFLISWVEFFNSNIWGRRLINQVNNLQRFRPTVTTLITIPLFIWKFIHFFFCLSKYLFLIIILAHTTLSLPYNTTHLLIFIKTN